MDFEKTIIYKKKTGIVAAGVASTSYAYGSLSSDSNIYDKINIGHIQFVNEWQNAGNWNSFITDYKVEAEINGEWVEIANYNVQDAHNYTEDYHVYGREWSESQIKFYLDNELIRSLSNTLCDSELNIFLSLAVLEHGGEVTDAIDGTSMKIDWVKYYKKNKI